MPARRMAVILHDIVATILALYVAFLLRAAPGDFQGFAENLPLITLIMAPVAALAYWFFGLYQGVWRFASRPDLLNIVRASAALTLALAAIGFLFPSETVVVPRSVPVIYGIVQMLLLAGPRLAYRALRERRLRRATGETRRIPVLIAGDGVEAERIVRTFQDQPSSAMEVVGLLARKHSHVGERIRGVPVLGCYSDFEHVVASLHESGKPRRLIFTREALSDTAIRDDLLAATHRLGLIALRSQGGLAGFDPNRISLGPIAIEDLLGRDAHDLDLSRVSALLKGRRVLVTGAGGSIGSELCRQIAGMKPDRLILVEHSEHALYGITQELRRASPDVELMPRLCDVRDRAAVDRLFQGARPELVFHAAALKHVDIVETHPIEGVRTNVLGVRNVADATLACGALTQVYISTDKAVSPVSVLGTSKKAGELYCRVLDSEASARTPSTRLLTVRFGNVLGSSGSVVPLFRKQLAAGGPITVTHPEVERFFMTTSEAVTLLLMATALGLDEKTPRRSVYILDMGKPVRIVDLAIQMIRLAGLEPDRDIPIVFTGLRPGERLKEQLREPDEALTPTEVEGVLAAEAPHLDAGAVRARFKALDATIAGGDENAVKAAVAVLVREEGTPTKPDANVIAEAGHAGAPRRQQPAAASS